MHLLTCLGIRCRLRMVITACKDGDEQPREALLPQPL
jgi:hypothetical protein